MYSAEEFLWFCKAASRRVGDDGLCPVGQRAVLVGQQGAVLICQEESRHDGIDAEAWAELRGKLGCHVLCVIADGSLCSTIAHDASERTQRAFGAEVDDGTLLILCHYGHEYLCGQC